MQRLFGALLAGIWLLGSPGTGMAAELVMFEQAGCEWCAAWDREIGPIYPKTSEGRRAPLRRVDIYRERPADLSGIKGVRFTPTFVLVEDSREIGRIQGYPGEDFFWGMLANLVERLPSPGATQTSNAIR